MSGQHISVHSTATLITQWVKTNPDKKEEEVIIGQIDNAIDIISHSPAGKVDDSVSIELKGRVKGGIVGNEMAVQAIAQEVINQKTTVDNDHLERLSSSSRERISELGKACGSRQQIHSIIRVLGGASTEPLANYLKEHCSDDFSVGPLQKKEDIETWFNEIKLQSGGYHIEKIEPSTRLETEGVSVFSVLAKNKITGLNQSFTITLENKMPYLIKKIEGDPITETHLPLPSERTLSNEQISTQMGAFLETMGEAGAFSGVVLFAPKGGEVFVKAVGNAHEKSEVVLNTEDTRFNLASSGKLFTVAAIAKLVDDGKISYSDTLDKLLPRENQKEHWLPNVNGDDWGKITVEQLLTHNSGLVGNYHDHPNFEVNPHAFSTINDFKALFAGNEGVHKEGLMYPPGTKHTEELEHGIGCTYCNTNFLLLGAIIEQVSGTSFREYVEENVTGKGNGMPQSGYPEFTMTQNDLAVGYEKQYQDGSGKVEWTDTLSKHVKRGGPDGGAASTVRDLHIFAKRYVENPGSFPIGFPSDDYEGIGKCYHHEGRFEGAASNISIFPETGDVLIILSNHDNGRGVFTSGVEQKIFDLLRHRKSE